MNQEITKVTEKPPFDRSGSQDSLDELSMEDYWTEVENIKKSSENRQDQEVVVVNEPDGNNSLNKTSVCLYPCLWEMTPWEGRGQPQQRKLRIGQPR